MTQQLTRRTGLILSAALLALPLAATAQTYPGRPVKLVVPYPPGSTPDALARIVAESLSVRIKQPVIIDNKGGAGGMIGAKAVSDAAPDGNTLLMFTPAWPAAKIFIKKPLVSVPDGLEPVTMVADGSIAFTAAGALPAKGFNEMVSYAKAHPGKVNFATTGLGDSLLYAHIIQREKGIKFEAIQYKGSAEYIAAMMANDVQLAFTPVYSMLPYVKDGKLKILAVTGDKRAKALPDVPTFAELGLPQVRNNWFALFAPRGTPSALVEKLNADLTAVIKSPEISKRIQDIYFEPVGSSAAQLRQRIQSDIDEWSALAKQVGIEPL
jgi:tripartite-type tricarboxylate transporter receptor subunit TctC